MYSPPSPGIELGSEMSQVSEVNECILQSTLPPTILPAHDVMPDEETSISDRYLKFADGKNQEKVFFNQCQI